MAEVSRPRGRLRCLVGGLVGLLVLTLVVPAYYWLKTQSPPGGPCDLNLSVLLEGRQYPNGSVVDRGDVYPPGYHFLYNGTTRGCLCRLQPCIRKCCGPDEYIVNDVEHARCEKNPKPSLFDNFTLPVYKNAAERANISRGHFRILYGDVCAFGKFRLTPDDTHYLLDNGHILLPAAPADLDAASYCLETLAGEDSVQTFVCFPPDEDDGSGDMFTFYPVGMILSMPFLVATFFTYAVIPDLRNLHGLSLMCHVTSLLTAYVALTVVQLGRDVSVRLCVILAYIIQFSFLATFFWLNIMCFDIWWVFSGLRPLRGSQKEREHKKFVLYSVYAWGAPLLILAVSLVMELVPTIPDTFIKPRFGVDRCWFKDSDALIVYFYLPIGMLVLLNLLMFFTTALRLRAHTKETKVLQNSESSRSDEMERQRLGLYLKLFIVMGINWVMELVSFALGGPKYIWYVTDLGNTLQGVLIFIIFVWKRRILRLLNQKLCPGLNLVAPTSTASRSKVSASRTSSTNMSKSVSCAPDGLALTPIAHAAGDDSDTNL